MWKKPAALLLTLNGLGIMEQVGIKHTPGKHKRARRPVHL